MRAREVSMLRKSWRSVRRDSSAIWPAISTPVGTGPDDDEGHQPLDLLGRAGELGPLEGAEDAAAQLERVVDGLHPGGEPGEVVVAEVALPRARGDDERVVGRDGLAVEDARGDGAGLEVDRGDVAQQDPGVVLAAQHLAGRRRDLALGEDAGGDLVEQRLEEVVGGLGDERDVHVRPAQGLGAEEPTEPGPDDDDAVTGLPGGLVRHVSTLL